MTDYRVVLVTAPGEETAATIARHLLEQGLAACVNIVPRVRSIYTWKGAVHDDAESMMLIKTRADLVTSLIKTVQAQHPYEVPEVIALPIEAGSHPYLNWITEVTRRS